MILASTSAFGWFIRAGLLFGLFSAARVLTRGSSPVKAYRGAVIFSALMGVIAWSTYGTHSEGDTTPVPFGDNDSHRVQDFKPTNGESVQDGFFYFLVIGFTSIVGVSAGLKDDERLRKLLQRISTPVKPLALEHRKTKSSGPLADDLANIRNDE